MLKMEEVYKNIIKSRSLNSKDKVKKLIRYVSRRRWAKKSWQHRHQRVFHLNKTYQNPCNKKIEDKHQKIWSVFRKNVDLSTLRISKNLSGEADARIIPEDIFVSDIEPTLIMDESAYLLSHKSFYNRWFPGGIFPDDIFHCINGQYLDSNLNPISLEELKKQAGDICYPVVMKPNWDSFGGKNIHFIENEEQLIDLSENSGDFVIQKQIIQHEFFRKYNPVGLNTIRVYVYKSVKDGSCHVLNMALRMGKGGSLDNETAGGIHTMINQEGFLNNYAVDKYGKKYDKHPDTGYTFDEMIPKLYKLKELAIKIALQVYFARIVGLDMCYDKDGNWRVIEVNTKGHTIRFSQYGGQPFFGEFTDEVIEYCKNNHWTFK